MERKDSICGGCSRGCNIEVETLDGFVKRLMPRENQDVNDWWMCDEGRYGWRHLYSDDRVLEARSPSGPLDSSRSISTFIEILDNSPRVGFLIDPFLTCEELHLIHALAASSSDSLVGGWLPDQGAAAEFPAGFKISADKHPNRNGAEQIFGLQVFGEDASHLRSALDDGSIETIVAFCGGPGSDGPGQEWSAALAKASTRVLFSVQEGNWLDGAALVFPATAPLEKEGTWVSEDDRLQRTRSCWKPGEAPFPGELVLLQSLQSALGTRSRSLSAAGIFRELSEVCAPFAGHNHSDIGSSGLLLSDRPAGVGAGGGA
jgi:NADH-quinone oxidoreductase subunit G